MKSPFDWIKFWAHKSPQNIAIECGKYSISYNEFYKKIINYKVEQNTFIHFISKPRSIDFLINLFAIWYNAGIPFTLSNDLPLKRKVFLLENMKKFSWYQTYLQPLYLISTSGSTGIPKIITGTWEGYCNCIQQQVNIFKIKSNSKVGWMLSPGFDASLSDIGCAFYAGATLVIKPENNIDFKWAQTLTHLDIPPVLLKYYLESGASKNINTIIFGGEVAEPKWVNQLSEKLRLINVYGPTETSICASYKICAGNWKKGNIGQPLRNLFFKILPKNITKISLIEKYLNGEKHCQNGELWIGGIGVNLGYLKEEKHSGYYWINNNSTSNYQGWFRTGDLVSKQNNDFFFIKRKDKQIQINGKRFDLNEIKLLCHTWDLTNERKVLEDISVTFNKKKLRVRLYWKRNFFSELLKIKLIHFLKDQLPKYAMPDIIDKNIPKDNVKLTVNQRLDSIQVIAMLSGLQKLGMKAKPKDFKENSNILYFLNPSKIPVEKLQIEAEKLYKKYFNNFNPCKLKENNQNNSTKLLISGGTGLIGSEMLDNIPAKYSEVFVLIRQKSFNKKINTNSKIKYITGDVTFKYWGISKKFWKLFEGCKILHVAGEVHLFKNFSELTKVNVLGTLNGLQLCHQLKGEFHFVSSLSVFVESNMSGKIKESDSLMKPKNIYGGYAQSKWVSDYLVQKSYNELKIPGNIYRLGLVVPLNKKFTEYTDQLSLILKGMKSLNSIPTKLTGINHLQKKFDITPLSLVSKCLWKGLNVPNKTIYHICNPYSQSKMNLLKLCSKYFSSVKQWSDLFPETKEEWICYLALNDFSSEGLDYHKGNLFLTSNVEFINENIINLYSFYNEEIQNIMNIKFSKFIKRNLQ